jgi:hypothetical protein
MINPTLEIKMQEWIINWQTALKREQFIEELKHNGGNISSACKTVGISRSTYYRWLNNNCLISEFYNNLSIAIVAAYLHIVQIALESCNSLFFLRVNVYRISHLTPKFEEKVKLFNQVNKDFSDATKKLWEKEEHARNPNVSQFEEEMRFMMNDLLENLERILENKGIIALEETMREHKSNR